MIIIAWNSQTPFPDGWVACDGLNGTPDLRDKFIYGANSDGEIGTLGGAETHAHTMPKTGDEDGHSHGLVSLNSGPRLQTLTQKYLYPYEAPYNSIASPSHTHTATVGTSTTDPHYHTIGNTVAASSLPKHLVRLFIAKLPL